MDEIVITVETCPDSGQLIAHWDDPSGNGGLSTQAADLRQLQEHVAEAVQCHFDPEALPKAIRYHFVSDPVLATA